MTLLERVDQLESEIRDRVRQVVKQQAKIAEALVGNGDSNGKRGIYLRLALLESQVKQLKWIAVTIGGSAIATWVGLLVRSLSAE